MAILGNEHSNSTGLVRLYPTGAETLAFKRTTLF